MALCSTPHCAPRVAGQRIGVIGAARSGWGCASLLTQMGADVVVGDSKLFSEIAEDCARQIVETGAELLPGLRDLSQFGPLDMLVLSPGVPVNAPVVQQALAAGMPVLGEMELAFRFSKAPVIAVSGTNAKGTTCTLLGAMLDRGGVSARVCGNIGDPFSGAVANEQPPEVYVLEVSSFQLETIESFRPHIAVLMNITPDHLDRHGSFEAYLVTKARLFQNQTAADWAILNVDDPNVLRAAEGAQARCLYFSATRADAQARLVGETLLADVGVGPVEVCNTDDLVRAGRPYIESVLAAAAAALIAGADAAGLLDAVRTHKLPDHVLDVVCEANGVRFINSSKATNPAAAQADIESVEGPLLVIAGGLEKKADFTEFGQLLSSRSKGVFLIGECAQRIARATQGVPVARCETLEEAVTRAYEAAKPGDAVMLVPACASMDMFDNYKARGARFRDVALEICRMANPTDRKVQSGGAKQL